ncbi:MAG: IS256 family transposase [Gemmatimonadota bacterium]|nr:MAG: IS256 family transposase [Gemmatimonadota bacterium]
MSKLAPSAGLREQVRAFLRDAGSVESGAEVLSELVRLATSRVIQEALEEEQKDFIGRERYVRVPGRGYRNGYVPGHVDTAEGRIGVQVPQVRDAGQPYRSLLYDFLRGHSDVLEQLVMEMYVRGMSTRDVEAAFTDATGGCLLSRTGVSVVTEHLWQEYEAFVSRDLSELDVLYLFLDGLYEPLRRHGIRREAVLCAWAITRGGEKVLVHLALGSRESYESWLGFLRDLVRRGLPTPLTITTDGAPGLLQAVSEIWPSSLRLRCWVHRMRNVLGKVPDRLRAEVKAHLLAVRDAPTPEAGQLAAEAFLARYGAELPSAAACFSEDVEALLAHHRLPWRHRKFVRTTNLIERSFVEERRRTKALPRFFTEASCLKLVHATLIRAAARWQRIMISKLELEQIETLRRDLGLAQPTAASTAAVA